MFLKGVKCQVFLKGVISARDERASEIHALESRRTRVARGAPKVSSLASPPSLARRVILLVRSSLAEITDFSHSDVPVILSLCF